MFDIHHRLCYYKWQVGWYYVIWNRCNEKFNISLKRNNKNIEVLKYLSLELRRANELKEIELGLRKVEDYSFNQNNQKKKIK